MTINYLGDKNNFAKNRQNNYLTYKIIKIKNRKNVNLIQNFPRPNCQNLSIKLTKN